MKIEITIFFLFTLLISGHSQTTKLQHIFVKEKNVYLEDITESTERFTPSAAEIVLVDSIAKSHISKNWAAYPWGKEIVDYHSYFRQYVGYMNIKKERIIFINSFCIPMKNWADDIVRVKGGGSCYFSIKINLTSGDAFDFHVNAPL